MTYVGVFGEACLVCRLNGNFALSGVNYVRPGGYNFLQLLPGRDILFLSQKYIYMRNN